MKLFKNSLPEVLLIIVIPLLTAGFTWFQTTPLYGNLIGTSGVEYAIEYKLQGLNFATSSPQYRLQAGDPELNNVWRIVKEYSPIIQATSTPPGNPTFIALYITKNYPVVGLPFNGQVKERPITPDATPLLVGFCRETPDTTTSQCYVNKNLFIVGTLGDLKQWTQDQTDWWRSTIDLWLAIISVLIGCVYLKRRWQPSKKPIPRRVEIDTEKSPENPMGA